MPGLIVHEWIAPHGGSENVVEAMARVLPGADILSLWNDAPGRFQGRAVKESWLARTPLRKSKAAALPFMPVTWARTDVSGYDYVLVSSHLFAHHVGGPVRADGPKKFVYVHTPARYIWTPELDARGDNVIARAVSPFLRRLDRDRARDGSIYAANSKYVRARILDTWGQESVVIYPPVDVTGLHSVGDWRAQLTGDELRTLEALPSSFVFGASRFVPYKRLDAVIAAGQAAGMPVVLAGAGPEEDLLRAAGEAANVPVAIVRAPSTAMLNALYERAAVFVFLAVEDFGIMPVEAMSLGTPSVVYHVGGARESVEALGGGAVVRSLEPEALAEGIDLALRVDMARAREAAPGLFGEEAFARNLKNWMDLDALR